MRGGSNENVGVMMLTAPAEAGSLVGRPRRFALDPRLGQIVAQTTFLVLELTWLDFGPSPVQAAVYIVGALLMDAAHARLSRRPLNWKSALSTGLSLSLL